ncbi:Transposase OS=Streptomyces fumanus OX=67302 GN=GCM10018772_01060 PE=4 SV=1 [Streptomyces fumanus]|uniref:Uncharacterized protein n=1 Tax=Streptomyces fumanus TaxID=67302 RepID=A0A919A1K4_9ACTN|nr:hypothetical protein GCM10018772_01060 [Streptomyces fumanus]
MALRGALAGRIGAHPPGDQSPPTAPAPGTTSGSGRGLLPVTALAANGTLRLRTKVIYELIWRQRRNGCHP